MTEVSNKPHWSEVCTAATETLPQVERYAVKPRPGGTGYEIEALASKLKDALTFLKDTAADNDKRKSRAADLVDQVTNEIEAALWSSGGTFEDSHDAPAAICVREYRRCKREALENDPASPILKRMLVRHQTTKVRVLRQVAAVLEAQS